MILTFLEWTHIKLEWTHIKNVRFKEMQSLLEAYGFQLVRINGSHHIFENSSIPELINLQNVKGKVKPYQVKQFLTIVETYNLSLGEDE